MKIGMTLVEMAAEVERQAALKKDFVAPSSALTMAYRDNRVTMEAPKVGGFSINSLAHSHIASNYGIPKEYYDRKLEKAPALLAADVNHWMRLEPKKHLVRTLEGKMRAMLSDTYRPLDNIDLMTSLVPMILDNGRELQVLSCQVTENKLYLKMAVPSLVDAVAVGDDVMSGFIVSNSEVGQGNLEVSPFLTQLSCTNGQKMERFGKKRRHAGKSLMGEDEGVEQFYRDETRQAADVAYFLQIRDVVQACLEEATFTKLIAGLREATGKKIEANPEDAIEVVANRYAMSESQKTSVLRHLIDGGRGLNAYGLMSAISRTAEDQEDYDEASRLESAAGEIVTLDPGTWKVISQAELVPVRRRSKTLN